MEQANLKFCLICNQQFTSLPQHPNQKCCTNKICKRKQKSMWTKNKMQTDSDYRETQAKANKKWRKNNPNYQQNYRKNKMTKIENIEFKIPKSINLSILKSGIYNLKILHYNEKIDSLIVQLDLLSNG